VTAFSVWVRDETSFVVTIPEDVPNVSKLDGRGRIEVVPDPAAWPSNEEIRLAAEQALGHPVYKVKFVDAGDSLLEGVYEIMVREEDLARDLDDMAQAKRLLDDEREEAHCRHDSTAESFLRVYGWLCREHGHLDHLDDLVEEWPCETRAAAAKALGGVP